jgi:hypothetical protein
VTCPFLYALLRLHEIYKSVANLLTQFFTEQS